MFNEQVYQELKLLTLSAKIDCLLLEAKLEQDRQKVNVALDKLHSCIKEYDELLNKVYGL